MFKNIIKMTHSLFGERKNITGDNVSGNSYALENTSHNQLHNGNGDNVAGNKYELKDLMPDELKSLSIDIFNDVGKGDFPNARNSIKAIESIGRIGKESQPYLEALKLISDLTDSSEAEIVHPRISRAFAESDSSKDKDMFLAAMIRLRLLQKNKEGAIEVYKNESNPGFLSKCQYFEFLAVDEELEVEANSSFNSDIEILAVIKGFLRNENSRGALKLAEKAKRDFGGYETEVVYLQSISVEIGNDLDGRGFWFIEKSLKDKIVKISEEVATLIDNAEGKDKRLYSLAVPILTYSSSASQGLNNACWKYIEKWANDFPEFAAFLYATEKEDYSYLSDDIRQGFLLRESGARRDELRGKVLSSQELEITDILLVIEYLDKSVIDKLIAKEDEIFILGGDDATKSFVKLLLYSASSTLHFGYKRKIPSLIQDFYNNDGDFRVINPWLLEKLVRNLHRHDLYIDSCSILEPILPLNDPWLSPIMKEYLIALYNGNQFKSFQIVLNKLHADAQESSFYWSVKAHFQANKKQAPDSLKSINRALGLEPNSTSFLLQKARILLTFDKSDNIEAFLDNIDISVIDIDDEDSIQLLALMYHFVRFSKVEKIAVNLFLRDPVKASKIITDLHFGHTISRVSSKELEPSYKDVGSSISGFEFSQMDNRRRVIVIDNYKYSSNQYVVHADTNLGKALLSLNEGETDDGLVNGLTLHKKMPPYVAAFQISCTIRHEINDGGDSFYMLKVPENGKDLLEYMGSVLKKFSPEKKPDVFGDPNIPLLMKGKSINSKEPAKAAFELFIDASIVKMILPVEKLAAPPIKFITDAYTIIYVALTGIAESFCETDFYVTEETSLIIKNYRETITSADYMTIAVNSDGRFLRTLAKDIEREFGVFLEGLDKILKSVKEIENNDMLEEDFPRDLNFLKGGIDDSVIHTIIAAHSVSLPWLTIDNAIGSLVSRYDIDVYPMHIFASKLSKNTTLSKKINGLNLHAFSGLPFPVHNEDLLSLLFEFNALSLTILKKILMIHQAAILEDEGLNYCLDGMPLYVAFKLERNSLPSVVQSAISLLNTVFRLQISRKNRYTAEFKLAQSIRYSLIKAREAGVDLKILDPIYNNFISGHFLDGSMVLKYLHQENNVSYDAVE
ncbi:GapS6b family protein [Halomonas sp. AOP13-D3-9]